MADFTNDFEELKAAASEGKLAEAATALQDPDIDEATLLGILPLGAIRLAFTLADASEFLELNETLEMSSVTAAELESLRQLVDEEMSSIRQHPTVNNLILGEAGPQTVRHPALTLNQIRSIRGVPMLVGDPGEWLPTVRLAFGGGEGELLLDTTATWGDLFHVASSMLSLLADDLERYPTQAERGELTEPIAPENATGRWKEVHDSLARIREAAPIYGILIPEDLADPPATADQD